MRTAGIFLGSLLMLALFMLALVSGNYPPAVESGAGGEAGEDDAHGQRLFEREPAAPCVQRFPADNCHIERFQGAGERFAQQPQRINLQQVSQRQANDDRHHA